MVHEDETRAAKVQNEPENRPSYWAEKDDRLSATSSDRGALSHWNVALPVAVVIMTGLVAFLIVWMVVHNGGKDSANPAPASSASSVSSASGPATSVSSTTQPSGTSDTPAQNNQPTETVTATATRTTHNSDPQEAAFPGSSISTCGGGSAIGDNDVRLARGKTTSCDFVTSASRDVKSRVASDPSVTSFSVSTYSAYRQSLIDQGKKVTPNSPYVELSCTRDAGLSHCTNSGDAAVEMWVRD